jgi:hypothetical protein
MNSRHLKVSHHRAISRQSCARWPPMPFMQRVLDVIERVAEHV